MPKLSVLIPSYNHAQYLEQRIESVLNQSFTDFEIIILDDHSTDQSRDIIEKYRGNNKIREILYNQVNSGSTFKQWEKGISLCQGEYIWIAESDDWCEPSFLETVLGGVLENKDCVLGFCQSYCLEDTNVIRWQSGAAYLSNCMEGETFIKKHMVTGTAIFNASMAVWKRDVHSQLSKEFLNFKYCGDWLFWIEICRHGRVFISGKLLNYFRKHSSDVSGKAIESGDDLLEEIKLFIVLFRRQWIDSNEFMTALKGLYVGYKGVERRLTPETRTRIKELLFTEPKLKSELQSYYRVYHSKHLIKKMLKALPIFNS
ncbi:MAG: glycosyltransferase family 2 protein [Verrucomicrobiota bacterium]|nr:glycosyltransferase family 2 protein [Verrucomicrobiota bacterium]